CESPPLILLSQTPYITILVNNTFDYIYN
ncbi:uncharacterized protein METZ01_LOCUS475773, partial [marine metagenome]